MSVKKATSGTAAATTPITTLATTATISILVFRNRSNSCVPGLTLGRRRLNLGPELEESAQELGQLDGQHHQPKRNVLQSWESTFWDKERKCKHFSQSTLAQACFALDRKSLR